MVKNKPQKTVRMILWPWKRVQIISGTIGINLDCSRLTGVYGYPTIQSCVAFQLFFICMVTYSHTHIFVCMYILLISGTGLYHLFLWSGFFFSLNILLKTCLSLETSSLETSAYCSVVWEHHSFLNWFPESEHLCYFQYFIILKSVIMNIFVHTYPCVRLFEWQGMHI